jgi:hypothetical protein
MISLLTQLFNTVEKKLQQSYALSILYKLYSNIQKDFRQLKQPKAYVLYTVYLKIIITLFYIIVYMSLYNSLGLCLVYFSGTLCNFYIPENPSLLYNMFFYYFWFTFAIGFNLWLLVQFAVPRSLLLSVIGSCDFNTYLGANPGSELKTLILKTYGFTIAGSLASKYAFDYLEHINKERTVESIRKAVVKSRESCAPNDSIHLQPTMSEKDIKEIFTSNRGILSTLERMFGATDPSSNTTLKNGNLSAMTADVLKKK